MSEFRWWQRRARYEAELDALLAEITRNYEAQIEQLERIEQIVRLAEYQRSFR